MALVSIAICVANGSAGGGAKCGSGGAGGAGGGPGGMGRFPGGGAGMRDGAANEGEPVLTLEVVDPIILDKVGAFEADAELDAWDAGLCRRALVLVLVVIVEVAFFLDVDAALVALVLALSFSSSDNARTSSRRGGNGTSTIADAV